MGGLLCCARYQKTEDIPTNNRSDYSEVYCIFCGAPSPYMIKKPCGFIPVVYSGGYVCDDHR